MGLILKLGDWLLKDSVFSKQVQAASPADSVLFLLRALAVWACLFSVLSQAHLPS